MKKTKTGKMILKLTILVFLGVASVSGNRQGIDVAVDNILNFFECDTILKSWIENSTKAIFDVENSTLTVDLTDLQERLWAKDCSNYNRLWLELWWVTPSQDRPENFGTVSYFSKFERCNQLEPEHFVFHSTKPLVAIENLREDGREQVQFNHIVENQYVLRVCPCGGGWHKSRQQRMQKICDCKNQFYGRPHCSPVVNLDPDPADIVFPWCRQGYLKSNGRHVYSPRPSIHSPVVNCTSVLVSGVMGSCTPLKVYDRVRLTLFQVETENMTKSNKTAFRCNQKLHFGKQDPISIETDLHSFNQSHGEFSVYLVNLSPHSLHCLQIELVDHPYCNPHMMSVGNLDGWRTPGVCLSHASHPIATPQCHKEPGPVVPQPNKESYIISILALILGVWFGIIVMCTMFCCIRRKTMALSRKEQEMKGKRGGRKAKASTTSSCVDQMSEESSQKLSGGDVFLISLPGFGNSKSEDVHAMFRNWIQSLGCHVHDMTDPEQEERINSDPEGWVLEILSDPNVKVVVVENKEEVAKNPKYDTLVFLEKRNDDVEFVETSSTKSFECCSTKNSEVETDCNGYVRVAYHSSLKKILPSKDHNQYSTVSQLAPWSTGSTDLDPSSRTSSVPSSLNEDHRDTDLLLEDSRHDLRIFAWKYIQSHFVGKYNSVLFVRYTQGGKDKNSVGPANCVTPQRLSLLIPYHMQEIKKWLLPDTSCNRRSSKHSADKKVELCEKRLNASLLMSQYDCI